LFFFLSEQVTRAESSNPVPPLKSSGKRAAQPGKRHPVRRSHHLTTWPYGRRLRRNLPRAGFRAQPMHLHNYRRQFQTSAALPRHPAQVYKMGRYRHQHTHAYTLSHTHTHTLPLLKPMNGRVPSPTHQCQASPSLPRRPGAGLWNGQMPSPTHACSRIVAHTCTHVAGLQSQGPATHPLDKNTSTREKHTRQSNAASSQRGPMCGVRHAGHAHSTLKSV
jgi:hypothetical protein